MAEQGAWWDALLARAERDKKLAWAIDLLTRLIDRRYPTGALRRSRLLALFDEAFTQAIEFIRRAAPDGFAHTAAGEPRPVPAHPRDVIVVPAEGFEAQGPNSLALELVRLCRQGWRRFIVVQARGHRFIANGLGPANHSVHIDVYGSLGDYLASGIDGAEVFVHGSAQDQLAQIMKDRLLVVYGDVGQTFMYGAKGGKAFVLGNAAGRPLINAVGRPHVVINGTCLDYLAESFMAGDPTGGGGFVILNGIACDDDGRIVELDTPYPGGNLFSLASGGAIYVRDPHRKLSAEQLNGGVFAEGDSRDWDLINPTWKRTSGCWASPWRACSR